MGIFPKRQLYYYTNLKQVERLFAMYNQVLNVLKVLFFGTLLTLLSACGQTTPPTGEKANWVENHKVQTAFQKAQQFYGTVVRVEQLEGTTQLRLSWTRQGQKRVQVIRLHSYGTESLPSGLFRVNLFDLSGKAFFMTFNQQAKAQSVLRALAATNRAFLVVPHQTNPAQGVQTATAPQVDRSTLGGKVEGVETDLQQVLNQISQDQKILGEIGKGVNQMTLQVGQVEQQVWSIDQTLGQVQQVFMLQPQAQQMQGQAFPQMTTHMGAGGTSQLAPQTATPLGH